jgi:ATP-dependent RNA helicase DeaD
MTSFENAGLRPEILVAIAELGYEHPTAIQEEVIPYLLNNESDLIALAQTGTGKTAAFGLPMVQKVDSSQRHVQALVLCPTRELCLQITADLLDYAVKMDDISIVPVYGGAPIEKQVSLLKSGAHIVVGTPGRVLDLVTRRKLSLGKVRMLVLDEADEMLNMGFKDDLDAILADVPAGRQTMLFSATMSSEISGIARRYMNEPHEISVGKKNSGAENVAHIYYTVHARNKYEALKRIADFNPRIYGIVFCRTRQEAKDIAERLIQDGYNADALHGDLSQVQRDQVMSRFRTKHLQILVATDVAARGLDVDDLTHIINFSLPDDNEVYIHRSGRTGRAGKSGISISIVHTKESGTVRNLERMLNKKFEQRQVPTGPEVCEKQLFNLVEKVERVEVDENQIDQYLKAIYKKLSWLERDELIKRFVSVEFNRFLDYYRNAEDLNVKNDRERGDRPDRERGDRPERDFRDNPRDKTSFSRFHINIGSNHFIQPANLIGIINDTQRLRGAQIGKIEILRNFSFFEIESQYAAEVEAAFRGMEHKGAPIIVTSANERPQWAGKTQSQGEFKKSPRGGFQSRDDKGAKSKPFTAPGKGEWTNKFRKDWGASGSAGEAQKKSGGFNQGKARRKRFD